MEEDLGEDFGEDFGADLVDETAPPEEHFNNLPIDRPDQEEAIDLSELRRNQFLEITKEIASCVHFPQDDSLQLPHVTPISFSSELYRGSAAVFRHTQDRSRML